jgi:hypothetical protein
MSEHDIVEEWLQIAYEDYDSALYLLGIGALQLRIEKTGSSKIGTG